MSTGPRGYAQCQCPACADLAIDSTLCLSCESAGCTIDSAAADCARSVEE